MNLLRSHTIATIRDYAYGMVNGERARIVCPECGGGSTKERSLSLYREGPRASCYCYRDSCSLNRLLIDVVRGASIRTINPSTTPARKSSYGGKTLPAPPDWYDYVPSNVQCLLTERGDILIPIKDRLGRRRGDCVRQTKPYDTSRPKALSLYEEGYDGMSWFFPVDAKDAALIVVEDPLSAMRLAEAGHIGVALMGTTITRERIRHLMKETRPINLALDADATATAVRAMRRHMVTTRLHVHVLYNDIKDMSSEELLNFLTVVVV